MLVHDFDSGPRLMENSLTFFVPHFKYDHSPPKWKKWLVDVWAEPELMWVRLDELWLLPTDCPADLPA